MEREREGLQQHLLEPCALRRQQSQSPTSLPFALPLYLSFSLSLPLAFSRCFCVSIPASLHITSHSFCSTLIQIFIYSSSHGCLFIFLFFAWTPHTFHSSGARRNPLPALFPPSLSLVLLFLLPKSSLKNLLVSPPFSLFPPSCCHTLSFSALSLLSI